ASGRLAVRTMSRSMRWSIRWLIAAAEAAASQMPMKPATAWRSGGSPGTARNMPTSAVNTISDTTRGLVSSQYWSIRARTSVDPAQPRQQRDQDEHQQRRAGVVHDGHRQRQRQLHVQDAEA